MSILTCFLLALILNHAASLTFNFQKITQKNSRDINISANNGTSITDDGIQVTPENNRNDSSRQAGRATYINQLQLWDNVSNDLASFSTSFSFVIDSYKKEQYADGLTFFLAEDNSAVVGGGAMGLPFDLVTNSRISRFVTVEFDTFCNYEWDPKEAGVCVGRHVGININSLSSVAYKNWSSNIEYGKECMAQIEYSSYSNTLSVSFTSFEENVPVLVTGLNFTVDLRTVLPSWVIFGFSASTGRYYEKNNVKSWKFNSSEFKVDQTPTASRHVVKGKTMQPGLIVGSIAGTLLLVTVFGILAYFLCWRKKKDGDNVKEVGSTVERDHELEMEAAMPRRYSYTELAKSNNELEMEAAMPRRFSYIELAQSTTNFSEKLGEGGFGGVYKGFLKDLSKYVAVKRVSKTSSQGMKEYAAEVKIISRLRHRNLVQLSGWCHEKGELLVVYEFLENGSLDLHLFKGKSLLTWNTRYKISLGLASALLYLHEGWEQCVLHRDIKSSNVMLDSNFNAKLGDFGLAKLVDHENVSNTTMCAGTFGYMAPEYVMTGRASKESDVFSFGVVVLEIACGRKSIHLEAQEGKTQLVELVWDLYGSGTLVEAADPRLGSDFSDEEIKRLMIVGLWCVHPDSDLRPSIKQAIQVLNFEAPPPILPSKMPKVTYSALQTSSTYDGTSTSGSNKTATSHF